MTALALRLLPEAGRGKLMSTKQQPILERVSINWTELGDISPSLSVIKVQLPSFLSRSSSITPPCPGTILSPTQALMDPGGWLESHCHRSSSHDLGTVGSPVSNARNIMGIKLHSIFSSINRTCKSVVPHTWASLVPHQLDDHWLSGLPAMCCSSICKEVSESGMQYSHQVCGGLWPRSQQWPSAWQS